jgi:hypothetical protein
MGGRYDDPASPANRHGLEAPIGQPAAHGLRADSEPARSLGHRDGRGLGPGCPERGDLPAQGLDGLGNGCADGGRDHVI